MRALVGAFCVIICIVGGSFPAAPKKPRHDDDCVPVAVHVHPNGMVIGEEDCDGERVFTKMGTR
jgi:hypothetical protein